MEKEISRIAEPRPYGIPMKVAGPVGSEGEAHLLKQVQYLFELKQRLEASLPPTPVIPASSPIFL